MQTNSNEPQLELQLLDVLAPSQFGRACWFAAEKQSGPRVINVGEFEIHIGRALSTMKEDRPAFDIDHGLVLMALIKIHQEKVAKGIVSDLDDEDFRGVSYNEIAIMAFGGHGGEQIDRLKTALHGLRFTPTSIIAKGKKELELTFLETCGEFKISESGEVAIEELMFSRKFRDAMLGRENLRTFNLEQIRSRRTKLGKSAAMSFQSTLVAGKHTKQNPYVTTATKFIRKNGGTVGKYPSEDNKVFERGGGALVKDLNGLETSDGRETVVQLHKQGRGQAHKLYAYLINGRPSRKGRLIQTAKKFRGWTDEFIGLKLERKKSLEPHEVEQLKKIGVNLERAENFIVQFKALFPHGFDKVISATLDDKTAKSKTGLFIYKAIKYAEKNNA